MILSKLEAGEIHVKTLPAKNMYEMKIKLDQYLNIFVCPIYKMMQVCKTQQNIKKIYLCTIK